tara:strand:- start:314 stop:511 length:198 start_codon:yes stop_codon:yes gene_type:complete
MRKIRDFFREFYGEFINYINCLPDKEYKKNYNEEKDWNLWEEKEYSNSYEKIETPLFPKLQEQPS